MTHMSILIDDRLKEEGVRLFDKLGISLSSAISMFISQAVHEQAIPFQISQNKPKSITLASENVLSKEWLTPEEDLAWESL